MIKNKKTVKWNALYILFKEKTPMSEMINTRFTANYATCLPDLPYGIVRVSDKSYLNNRTLSSAQKILLCKELFMDEAHEHLHKKAIKQIPFIHIEKDSDLSICDDSVRGSFLRKSVLDLLENLESADEKIPSYLHLAPIAIFFILYGFNSVKIT